MSKLTNGAEQSHHKREYAVRVPKGPKRRLTIMKFNGSLNVKPENWTQEVVKMEREDNRRQGVTSRGEIVQEFGEGSEFGRAAREEARRKKLGRQTKKYEHDKQPWKLCIESEPGKTVGGVGRGEKMEEGKGNGEAAPKKTRKFRSIPEASAGDHADYWIFYRVGNDLEAYKVDEWYQFLSAISYKYLDADQAEERFQQQSKVFNQFALKAQIQKQLAEQEREQQGQLLVKNASGLKIKDEASSDEQYEADEEGEGENSAKGRKKNKAVVKEVKEKKSKANNKKKQTVEKNRKKQRVDAGDEVAAYESEDGEDEGREYDYMSDSGSDTDREELDTEQRMDEDLVGVTEEQGLKRTLKSDDEEEEEEKDESEEEEGAEGEEGKAEESNQKQQPAMEGDELKGTASIARGGKAVKNVDAIMAQRGGNKLASEVCADGGDSDGSDTDEDPDKEAIKSVLFMQDKRKKGQAITSELSRKRPATDAEEGPGKSSMEANAESKRPKLGEKEHGEEDDFDIINEEISELFVRRLLERKPHSTKQLLTKANQRLLQKQQQIGSVAASSSQHQVKDKRIVTRLAELLKKIQPYQFRKTNEARKEVLYFSLNRTA